MTKHRDCNIKDRGTAYHFLKSYFISAYKANGNIDLSLIIIARLRGVEKSHVESILASYLKTLKEKQCPDSV